MGVLAKFLIGLAAVLFLGIASINADFLPGSRNDIAETLQHTAERESRWAWAAFKTEGQGLFVSGEAPSEESLAELKAHIGDGSIFSGPFTKIDYRAVTIMPEPLPESPSEDLPDIGDVIASIPELNDEPEAPGGEVKDTIALPDGAEQTILKPIGIESSANQENGTIEESPVPAPSCRETLAASIAQTAVTFEPAESDIDGPSRAQLDSMANALNQCPDLLLTIVGHTDSQGSEAGNQELSGYRADAVAAYLRARGVPSARLATRGAGESEPLASNATREGRAQNRRIEFIMSE